ncbi:hypothetical protein DFP72DRAFT_1078515 [Ephemerocybe angulata]|uniref:HECT domain-containing protein n=1 Tax=Ephemerocybe angulata TaxID=980116 RepID=A0A8H6HCL8_9AGAR|nr:hypothetical protein DFP72DRAFT_1078515 [Tulosesus angulatus]
MDPNNLPFTPAQLAQLQAFLSAVMPASANPASQQPPVVPAIPPAPPAPPHQPPIVPAIPPVPTVPPQPAINPAPPIASLYQSVRAPQGHPSLTPQQSGGFQPFVGASSLSLPLTTSNVNQARMASANATVPRAPTLPVRGRRRGPASAPPGLPLVGVAGEVRRCYVEGTGNVRLTIKVYPTDIQSTQSRFIMFRFRKASFNQWLEQNSLYFELELPATSTIQSIMELTIARMASSSFSYQFPPGLVNANVPGEDFRLRLLRLVSRGQANSRHSGEVHLTPEPLLGPLTVESMMQLKSKFVGADSICIEKSPNRFVIHLAACSPSFIENGRKHHCLADRFAHRFPSDQQLLHPQDDPDTSGGEDNEEVSGETPNVQVSVPEQNAGAGGTSAMQPADPQVQPPLQPIPRAEPSLSSLQFSFLPDSLQWDTPWEHPRPILSTPLIDRGDLPVAAYADASRNSPNARLEIRGRNASECAEVYDQKLAEAALANDYTNMLATDRDFTILHESGRTLSLGEGVEREIIYLVFQKYLAQGALYFAPRLDDRCSPQISYSSIPSSRIPQNRLLMLKKLGAICALMMVVGQCPLPMDPSVFQFIVHDCNLRSLHPAFLAEWHPEMRQKLGHWLTLGPQDDISMFQHLFVSYLGTSVALYRDRDASGHQALGPLLLYQSLFGPDPPTHPSGKPSSKGLLCDAHRLILHHRQLIREFEGGSETFFSLLWSNAVHWDTLGPLVRYPEPSLRVAEALTVAGIPMSFGELFSEFLEGTGIPCPNRFAEVKASFSDLVDLSGVDHPDFRSRVFVWATTGHPFLDPELDSICVHVRSSSSRTGMLTPTQHALMHDQGKFAFGTCGRRMHIPEDHLVRMMEATYPPPDSVTGEPASFKDAFAYWAFTELINSIGEHSAI